MFNHALKILSTFVLVSSLLVTSSPAKADPPASIKIFTVQQFTSPAAKAHLRDMIRAFNDELAMHNLMVSSLLLTTIKTGPKGEDNNRARARSASAEEYDGKICVGIDGAFAGVTSESMMTDNPTDVETCFVWFPPE